MSVNETTEDVDADACGALGCKATTGLTEVNSSGKTRVLCEFHAQSFTGVDK